MHPCVHEREVAAGLRGHPFATACLHGAARPHDHVARAALEVFGELERVAVGGRVVVAHAASEYHQVVVVLSVVADGGEAAEGIAAAVMDGAHLPLRGAGVGRPEGSRPQAQAHGGVARLVGGEAEHVDELAGIFVDGLLDLLGGQVQRFVPGDLNPARVDLHALLGVRALHGSGDPVRVVQLQDRALAARAHHALAALASRVAFEVHHHAVLDGSDVAAVAVRHAHMAVAEYGLLLTRVRGDVGGLGECLDRLVRQRPAKGGGCAKRARALQKRTPGEFGFFHAHVAHPPSVSLSLFSLPRR